MKKRIAALLLSTVMAFSLNSMWKQRKDRKSRQQRNQADNRSRRGYELR